MRLLFKSSVAFLVLTAALVVFSPAGPAYADCQALTGHAPVGGVCHVTAAQSPLTVAAGSYTVEVTLEMDSGSKIVINPPGGALSIDITGNFIMDNPSEISGDSSVNNAPASPITISASGNMTLHNGSFIHSNNTAGSCTLDKNPGGNITLNAGVGGSTGVFTQENGSKIDSISPCGRGEIIITATKDVNIDGEVLSQATKTGERGGPITIKAACTVTESDTGTIISQGLDLGADLIHIEAGCQVEIFGLVASQGPGHKLGSDARCNPPARPSHSNRTSPYSTACVEIWAGNNTLNPGFPAILIDSRPPHNGQVVADTAQSGGVAGNGWIEIFARGDIEIDGDTVVPFAVHANQYRSNGHGGQVTVKSTEGSVNALGLALQASANKGLGGILLGGSDGGTIIVEAKHDVNLNNNTGEFEAAGSTSGTTAHGGTISIQAFGSVAPDGSINVTAPFTLDVTGGNGAPDGTVNLKACGTIGFPPGTIVPAGATVNQTTGVCGGAPTLPVYPAVGPIPALPPLPSCTQCGSKCACVTNFTPSHTAGTLTLNGDNLTVVDSVIFGTNCDPSSAVPNGTVLPPFTTQTGSQIQLQVPAGLANGSYKIIITNPGTPSGENSCCAANFFTKP